MKIFVTGGSGYVGQAVVRHLVEAGHRVTGLVRSSMAEARLGQVGARSVYGDLRQAAAYGAVAAEHDAIIHLAAEAGPGADQADRAVLTGLLDAARRSVRPHVLVYTSGVWVLGETGDRIVAEEASTSGAAPLVAWRPAHEKMTLEGSSPTLATAVVRPGLVFGGRGGFLGELFQSAEREGAAVYVGTGRNRWPLVHLEDLARLYRMVVEKGGRGIFHGVDGSEAPVGEIAEAASRAAGRGGACLPRPRELARRVMGELADALCLDQRVRARRSTELGWRPQRPTFLESADALYAEWRG